VRIIRTALDLHCVIVDSNKVVLLCMFRPPVSPTLFCSLISSCPHLKSYFCSLKKDSSVPRLPFHAFFFHTSYSMLLLIPFSSISCPPNPRFPCQCLPVPPSLPSPSISTYFPKIDLFLPSRLRLNSFRCLRLFPGNKSLFPKSKSLVLILLLKNITLS